MPLENGWHSSRPTVYRGMDRGIDLANKQHMRQFRKAVGASQTHRRMLQNRDHEPFNSVNEYQSFVFYLHDRRDTRFQDPERILWCDRRIVTRQVR